MSAIWKRKKQSFEAVARDVARRSPVFDLVGTQDQGAEWRMLGIFKTHTLVQCNDGIERLGPVHVGIRYCQGHLSTAPHPLELVSILAPLNVFHPNVAAAALCLGHPEAGVSLELILNQVWAGLNFNMKFVSTTHGDVVNPAAAEFVRRNTAMFPLTRRGLFESPEQPPESLTGEN